MQVLMDADLTGKAADASDRYKQVETEFEDLKSQNENNGSEGE